MSCPFGYGGLHSTQAMAAAQEARLNQTQHANANINPHHQPTPFSPPTQSPPMTATISTPPTPSSATSSSSSVSSPPPPQTPMSLFTGGLRTSLGVENVHPLAIWMKEMQSRGGLKGVDIDAELAGLTLPSGALSDDQLEREVEAKQKEKNWKEKRERPPVEFGSAANANGTTQPPTNENANGTNSSYLYPGVFPGRINHNSHEGESPMVKYDQEITYWNYIHSDLLTCLQNGRQGKGLNHHDEHLFILVHQVFELWFKQILWELEYVRNCLIGYRDPLLPQHPVESNPLARCVQRLNRADKIMRLATEGYAIMETMNPGDFLEFRDFLSPSSGFQSVQLREMEILLGLRDEDRIPCAGRHYREAFMANGENKTGVFDRRLKSEKTLKEALFIFLRRQPASSDLTGFMEQYFKVLNTQNAEKSKDFEEEMELLSKMLARATDAREKTYLNELVEKAKFGRQLAANSTTDVEKFFDDPVLGSARSSVLFLFTYHSHSALKDAAELCDAFLRFEQAVLLWRLRHARMIEMFIGRRPGTGGSSGVEYVDQTATQYRIFTDLWRIRSLCVSRSKIRYDPDTSAVWQGVYMSKFETDYQSVDSKIQEENKALQSKAKAQRKSASASTTTTSQPASVPLATPTVASPFEMEPSPDTVLVDASAVSAALAAGIAALDDAAI